ncbi:MAG: GTPase HflX [Bauldia sp.]|nr:GTPase HflX [Bauldia sp.]
MTEREPPGGTATPPADDVRRGDRALVLVPVLKGQGTAGRRTTSARVEEAAGLAAAIALEVVDAFHVPLQTPRPGTLFGDGKVAEIGARVAAEEIALVVVDHPLSPVQQRNLEKAWKTKVIDRTGLILEIFGERAQTSEGRLQVELAHLNYQKSRLVRSWTHLERQRGGFGFLGGPGETQIEADRRLIQERIARIERDLESAVQRRRLQRANRKRVPHPTVALVGYTNAGKSTLFNRLTAADIRAEDLLFATLDPTLRRIRLPHGTVAILSDTVGFISDLPTHLVAAFRATLEEVVEADIILHVRDIAHPDQAHQAADVAEVLSQLGVDARSPDRVIEVWNKVDLLAGRPAPAQEPGGPETIMVSALTGEGIATLLDAIERLLNAARSSFRLRLSGPSLGNLHALYQLGEVLERSEAPDGSVTVTVRVGEKSLSAFHRAFPQAIPESRPNVTAAE